MPNADIAGLANTVLVFIICLMAGGTIGFMFGDTTPTVLDPGGPGGAAPANIDDVLGIISLAVVTGSISAANAGTTFSADAIVFILFKALMFFVGAVVIGLFVSPHLFRIASRLRVRGMLLAAALLFCF